jgi:hypothetical protein
MLRYLNAGTQSSCDPFLFETEVEDLENIEVGMESAGSFYSGKQ